MATLIMNRKYKRIFYKAINKVGAADAYDKFNTRCFYTIRRLNKMYKANIKASENFDFDSAGALRDELFDVLKKEVKDNLTFRESVYNYSDFGAERRIVAKAHAYKILLDKYAPNSKVNVKVEPGRAHYDWVDRYFKTSDGLSDVLFPAYEILHEFTHFLQDIYKSSQPAWKIKLAQKNYMTDSYLYKYTNNGAKQILAKKIYDVNLEEKEAKYIGRPVLDEELVEYIDSLKQNG